MEKINKIMIVVCFILLVLLYYWQSYQLTTLEDQIQDQEIYYLRNEFFYLQKIDSLQDDLTCYLRCKFIELSHNLTPENTYFCIWDCD